MTNDYPAVAVDDVLPMFKSTDLFYVWFDDTPKKETSNKLDEAIEGFVARFAMRPSHALVNSVDLIGHADVIVSSGRTIQPNTFWLSNKNAVATNTR